MMHPENQLVSCMICHLVPGCRSCMDLIRLWDLLCYSEKSQLHIDPCFRTGLHKWYTIFLRRKIIRRADGVSVVGNIRRRSHHMLPWPVSRLPPSSRPFLQPCPTVRQQREERSHVTDAEMKGHRYTMPSATVMHRRVSAHIPLIWPPCHQLLSQSPLRLMRCQKLHLQQKSSAATSPAALTANDLSCCCGDIYDPGEGRVPSQPPEGAFRYISNDCWLQWDMRMTLFITGSVVKKMVSCERGFNREKSVFCSTPFSLHPSQL